MLSSVSKPVLSLIICSRNDNYMGNPMWRLATSINFLSEKVKQEGREKEVEIIVADWGSKVPISGVLELSKTSSQLTSFLHIPPEIALKLQQDSPFAEVYALNAAARASNGLYIGRIDQDTLVSANFIRMFFSMLEGRVDFGFDLQSSYLFAARKQLPYSFVKTEPSIASIDFIINRFSKWIYSEELSFCHWASPVSILLMHRDMWEETGGYDERLIHYWFMDVDLGTRLIKKYPIINIGKLFGYDFFHLEHIPTGFNFRYSHRKLNPDWSKSFNKPTMNPNGDSWGLSEFGLRLENLAIMPIEHSDIGKEKVKMSYLFQTNLFLKVIAGSLRRWGYHLVKYSLFLVKKVTNRDFL